MILIDSSFWIEFFEGTRFGKIIIEHHEFNNNNFIIPTIIITEVYKRFLRDKDEYTALLYTTQMKSGIVIDLDFEIALKSARVGIEFKLPIADSIIFATANKFEATIYTLDRHFEGLPNVNYYKK